MINKEYRNLSEFDIELADHYFETGNTAGLRELREKSKRQEVNTQPARWHHTRTNRA